MLPVIGEDAEPAELTLGMYREPEPGWRSLNEVELQFDDKVVISRWRYGMEYQINGWLSGSTALDRGPNDLEETLRQGYAAQFRIMDQTDLRVNFEHSRGAETGDDPLTSLALSVDWHNAPETVVIDTEFDTTFENDGKTYFAGLGVAMELNEDWTLLGRSRIALDQRGDRDRLRARTRIGASYRPLKDPRLDLLAWYENRIEEQYNRSETHMWSFDGSYEVHEDLRFNGKYAGQQQTLEHPEFSAKTTTQLLQAGAYLDFANDRFQIGANAAHMWDNRGGASSGVGVELGFSPTEGTLLSLGYNAMDAQVAGAEDLYQDGFYFRFNLLLDDSLWDRLGGFLGNG